MILKNLKPKFQIADLKRVIPITLISLIGIIALVSTEIDDAGRIVYTTIIQKQILFIIIGFVFYKIVSRFDYTYLKHIQISLAIYLVVILGLIATLVFGPVRHNAQRWIVVAGIQIQPSEFVKISVILLTLSILSLRSRYNQWILLGISAIPMIIAVIIIYMQPHGSMALIVLALWAVTAFLVLPNQLQNLLAGLLFIIVFVSAIIAKQTSIIIIVISILLAGIFGYFSKKNRALFVVVVGLAVVLGFGFNVFSEKIFVFEHQKDRIEAYFNNSTERESELFNVNQSKIAIGSGRFWGKGFGMGTQSKLRFLPEHQTDFIYASFSEEFGLVGSIFLLTCYAYLIYSILKDSMQITDSFGAALVAVLAFKIMLEVFINIGTNTGIIPATGIPLPLVSAGGSITIATFLSIGLIEAVIKHSS